MAAKTRGGRIRRWAGAFRRWPVHPQWLLGAREERRALRAAFSSLSGVVVDIGCADRRAAVHLPAMCAYVGVDYPGTAVALYGTRPDVFADAKQLPFGDATVDGVILKDVLEHVDGPHAALRECARIARPGAIMVVWMPFMYPVHDAPHDYQRYTHFGLEAYLEEAGFRIREASTVLKPMATAGLLAAIALGDCCEQILAQRRWLLPITPLLALSIAVVNILALAFSVLPGSRGFMPAFNRVVAVRRG